MTNLPEPHLGREPQTSTPTRWWWRPEDGSGGTVESAERPEFPSQGDAETWVGEVWQDLLTDGVEAVTLFEGDRLVYGPMSLRAG